MTTDPQNEAAPTVDVPRLVRPSFFSKALHGLVGRKIFVLPLQTGMKVPGKDSRFIAEGLYGVDLENADLWAIGGSWSGEICAVPVYTTERSVLNPSSLEAQARRDAIAILAKFLAEGDQEHPESDIHHSIVQAVREHRQLVPEEPASRR